MSERENAIYQRSNSMLVSNFLKRYAIIIALVCVWIIFAAVTSGVFVAPRNLSNLMMQLSVIGVLSVGMTVLLLTGNFDLSVGSVVGMTGLIAAQLITNNNYSPVIAIIIVLIIGIVVGAWQGFLIAYRKLPSFVATLAGMIIFRGVTLVLANGYAIPIQDERFLFLGSEYIPPTLGYIIAAVIIAVYIILFFRKRVLARRNNFVPVPIRKQLLPFIGIIAGIIVFVFVMNLYQGIPLILVFLIVLAALFSLILNKTRFGKYVYAIGGNIEAAKISGINVKKNLFVCFTLMGLLSALAGIMLAARLGNTTNNAGLLYEMDTISACIIGGVSLTGGLGKISNAIIGTVLIMSLSNGMSLLNINTMTQAVVRGVVFIIAVWFDVKYRVKRA